MFAFGKLYVHGMGYAIPGGCVVTLVIQLDTTTGIVLPLRDAAGRGVVDYPVTQKLVLLIDPSGSDLLGRLREERSRFATRRARHRKIADVERKQMGCINDTS
jgi:hypothetical protein